MEWIRPNGSGGYTRILCVQDAVHFALKRAGFKMPGNSKISRQCLGLGDFPGLKEAKRDLRVKRRRLGQTNTCHAEPGSSSAPGMFQVIRTLGQLLVTAKYAENPFLCSAVRPFI